MRTAYRSTIRLTARGATATCTPNRVARITLGHSARPTVAVQTASTVAGTHSQPTLQTGTQTTATATVTNTGATTLADVKINLRAPQGWTTSPAVAAGDIPPGTSVNVTFEVTSASTANGGNGLVATATYDAPDHVSGAVSAEQWVIAQKPLPLPPGAADLALTATASASYTSPWTSVSAVNNGLYPIQSSDDGNLTPYWGDWPQTGSHRVELDWASPITTNGTEVYWADGGGGLLTPSSWVVQYWNGSTWVNVGNQSGEPTTLDTFNQVTFDPATTTKLRLSMQSTDTASLGVIQWIVPSIPNP